MNWRIGAVTVTKIVELEVTGGSRFLLPQATYDECCRSTGCGRDFADERGRLKMSVHALVVETPGRRIIVDTCIGNDKENRRIPAWSRMQTTVPRRPRRRRLSPRDHRHRRMHPSPCRPCRLEHDAGRRARWVPTFPNARYLMGRVEYRALDHPARARRYDGGASPIP